MIWATAYAALILGIVGRTFYRLHWLEGRSMRMTIAITTAQLSMGVLLIYLVVREVP